MTSTSTTSTPVGQSRSYRPRPSLLNTEEPDVARGAAVPEVYEHGVVSTYHFAHNKVFEDKDATDPIVLQQATWVDMLDPDEEQRAFVGEALGIRIPRPETLAPLGEGRQIYHDCGALIIGSRVLGRIGGRTVRLVPVTFILCAGRLVTVRHGDPRPFHTFVEEVRDDPRQLGSGHIALVGLLGAIVGRAAELLQMVGDELEVLSTGIFVDHQASRIQTGDLDLRQAIQKIGHNGYLATRVRESLHSLRRAVPYIRSAWTGDPSGDLEEGLRALEGDIATLLDHEGHIMANVTFLLDATLGLIDIRQSGIIKIFSVAAVILMPPTLVASIYGMNFKHMPELDWLLGYPYALALMVASAVLPYLYFRRCGWL